MSAIILPFPRLPPADHLERACERLIANFDAATKHLPDAAEIQRRMRDRWLKQVQAGE